MLGQKGRLTVAALAAASVLAFAPDAGAQSLYDNLVELVRTQKQVKAAEADLEAATQRSEAAWKKWYPELSFTGSYGWEKQNNTRGTADTEGVPREVDLKLSQQLWDFGSTNAGIRRSRLETDRARANLAAARQNIVLQGIDAHMSLIRAKKVLGFADGSVANIRRQAALEDSRVQRGGGFTTDVLQAKTQLAGAEARRTNFNAAFQNAINNYRRYFNREPGKVDDMKDPRVPFELVPKTLDEVIQIVHESNPGLKAARLDADILRETISQVRADEFFPTLNATAEQKRKQDVGGTLGNENEQLFKVELTYSLSLGLTERNTLRAAKGDHLASTNRYIDNRDAIERATRDQWSNLERDRLNAEFLKNQANIAAEFLELARRERQLGKRSLIDVLAGETALINANADATAAETDVALDVFRLINLMGQLEPEVIK
ncbi:MAG: TolC family protein [Rhodospirillales bacterium]|nr:TolC family protein [Rhodospirillales bacterium]